MPTPLIHSNGPAIGLSPRYAFLRHLNTSTLALCLFVAFALLGTTRAKESQNDKWTHFTETDAELVVRPSHAPTLARQEIHIPAIVPHSHGIFETLWLSDSPKRPHSPGAPESGR
jgi:hypothetical protein